MAQKKILRGRRASGLVQLILCSKSHNVRVSAADQNPGRQIEALKPYNLNKTFKEKITGKDTNRPQLKAMLEFVRERDTVYIESIPVGEQLSKVPTQR